MKVIEHFLNASKTHFSIEVLPPIKGQQGIEDLYKVLDPLMEFKPPFIDVTYHREEYVYKRRSNGLLEKVPISRRPGTIGICAAIQGRYQVDTVPHLICGGFSKQATEDALVDMNYLGIDNVLILRGDALKHERTFVPHPEGHHYASDLLTQVKNINHGIYMDEDLKEARATDFCIGIAGYPEKHFESPNLQTDLRYLKHKVDCGADYIVTQLFFDNQKFFNFVRSCREIGIKIPIIPGIKPITSFNQVQTIPPIFHVDLPLELTEALEACKTKEAIRQVGIEWGVQQCKELIDFGVPCIHFYTMSRYLATMAICKEIF